MLHVHKKCIFICIFKKIFAKSEIKILARAEWLPSSLMSIYFLEKQNRNLHMIIKKLNLYIQTIQQFLLKDSILLVLAKIILLAGAIWSMD